ncbi:MAG TPA: gamma-glutamylcyclotransferase family protein [Pyrinomonadaceae bacterium]|nr:gamma-glutamylcyclotransferase family protein [Pyrinomonadaceae bacterium]
MEERRVCVFFYGLYMDFEVLGRHGVSAERWEVASLAGYDFNVASWGHLVASDRGRVYGLNVAVTHQDLERLYGPSNTFLKLRYFPEPVLVETAGGQFVPALCYVAHERPEGPVNKDYVEGMIRLSKKYGFPEWYAERLAGFLA